MDDRQFDNLARALGRGITRRGLFGSVAAAAAGLVAKSGTALAACRPGGGVCYKNNQCCSGVCLERDSTGRRRCACGADEVSCGGRCVPAAKLANDPKNCGACGNVCPSSECGVGVCNGGVCGIAPNPSKVGRSCNTGSLCEPNGICQTDGSCAGTPVTCSVADGRCASAACDPATGKCVTTNFAAGTSCSDGNRCDGNEACDGNGVCQSGLPIDCSLVVTDARCGSVVCNPTTGQCEITLVPEGTNCGVTDVCRGEQTCGADGICHRADPINCSIQATDCTDAICNPQTKSCDLISLAAGTPCGDGGDACSGFRVCDGAGACDSDPPLDCTKYEGPCRTVVCNPDTGVCDVTYSPLGTVCQAGDACTADSTCDATGTCRPGKTLVDCSNLNTSCQTATCNPTTGACDLVTAGNGTVCDVGVPCVSFGVCQNGVCSSQPTQCFVPPGAEKCARAYCDPNTGHCAVENYSAGTSCSDNIGCDGNEQCDGTGVCRVVSGANNCDKLDTDCRNFFCDADSSSPTFGQCASIDKPYGTSCNGGNGVCIAGECKLGGNDGFCSGGFTCISGGCLEGTCLHSGHAQACLTDWDCTSGFCVSGHCADGTAGEPCAADSDCLGNLLCKSGVCAAPTFANGVACTSFDQCDSGACGRIITAADQAKSPVCCVAEAGSCTTSTDCCSPTGAPHYCDTGVCTPAQLGSPCTNNIDCPNNLYCDQTMTICRYKGDFGDACSATQPCLSGYQCCQDSGTCKVCCQPDSQIVPAFAGCGPSSTNICCGGRCGGQISDTNCGCGIDCTTGQGCNGTTQYGFCKKDSNGNYVPGVCQNNGYISSCFAGGYCDPDCHKNNTCTLESDLFSYARECSTPMNVIISTNQLCKKDSDCPSSKPFCVTTCPTSVSGLYCTDPTIAYCSATR